MTEPHAAAMARGVVVLAAEAQGRMALRAFVVAAPGVAEGLAFMQPAGIELLDALPLLPGGKPDTRALLSRGAARA
ncbi:hypothetical protein [Falsiroseomonas sp. HW251]|uniref:hypothetical protein n=1 Tax=Falsiroseomonas sp. HW251 TaxID=3390998 RepID=UPI003D314D6D